MTSYLNLHLPIQDATWIFFLVLLIILIAPLLFGKLRIPHIIGMILAGVLIGEHGLNILTRDASFELFGKVGMFYIMFLAGLEMDMKGFKQNMTKSIVFGFLTTFIPFGCGFFAGYHLLHYSLSASLLLACIFGSHTLVAYPIISRYGLQKHPVVTISISATMIALLAALIILAAISGTYKGSGDSWFWVLFAFKCVAYFAGVFFIFPRIIRWFFKNYRDRVLQYTFVIAMVFFAAILADICGLESLLGAFIAGLIFNRFIPKTIPLMNRIEFIGNALFIPYFLIGVGMMVNLEPLFTDKDAAIVVLIMVVVSTLSKGIAADVCRRIFKFSASRGLMMFGLTEAHAAGAIAMVMVGTKLEVSPGVPLMNNAVLDGVVAMILISCIISSIATDQGARQIKLNKEEELSKQGSDSQKGDDEKILVPVNDPQNIENLVQTAIMMRNIHLKRGIICLNVVNDNESNPRNEIISKEYLDKARDICNAAEVPVQLQSRLAVNIVNGVVHSLRENDASEILIGMHRTRKGDSTFFGSFANGLLQGMDRQLIIVRYNMPVTTIRKIVCVIPQNAEFEIGFYRWVERLSRLACEIGCRIEYNGSEEANKIIHDYNRKYHKSIRDDYQTSEEGKELSSYSETIRPDHLLVVVASRPGCISYQKSFTKMQTILQEKFANNSLMMIYPDQVGINDDSTSFSNPVNRK